MRILLPKKVDFPNRHTLRKVVMSSTQVSSNHLTPEIKLHLITPTCPLWRSHPGDSPFEDPYWAFFWAGGQALTRYILDNKPMFSKKNVIDIGSGCGACSIAAAVSDAKLVIANDVDSVSCEVISMNCSMNNKNVHILNQNLIGKILPLKIDILLIGDMFYDPEFGDKLFNWLMNMKENGVTVLIGDPGRHALGEDKTKKMKLLKEYLLMPHTILENNGFKSAYVWEL